MGKFIAASGNLAETPQLAHDKETGRPYTYVKVLVSDDYKTEDGKWAKTAPTEYSVRLTGKRAENVVQAAEAAGNIAVVFAGDVLEKPWGNAQRGGINRNVNRPTIFGYDAVGQDVTIAPRGRAKQNAEPVDQDPAGGPF